MKLLSSEYTDAKLIWLECILSQRLTSKLYLQASLNSILIRISGSTKYIEIKSDLERFGSDSNCIPCVTWNYDEGKWGTPNNNSLPAPSCSQLEFPLIENTGSGYKIKYDILGLIYWMLSRQEEVGRTDLDQQGRFPATASHAFKHNYLERPIVDEWLGVVKQVMQRVWPSLKFKRHQFELKVSHDVDVPSRYMFQSTFGMFRRMVGDMLKRGNFHDAIKAPWIRLQNNKVLLKNDPLNTFEWIMVQSEKNNLKSSFYFICGKTHTQTDADYDIEHPAIRSLMRVIHQRGHKIGLHPSYNTCHAPDLIVNEAKKLREVCDNEGIIQKEWGGRMHYLRWAHPTTLYGWEKAGMDYDSTLSYADHAGFRCGTCFEYPAYDPVADKQLNLRIRPLIAMDVTVSGYMGLGFDQAAYDKFMELKNSCRAVNGAFTLLWHNNQLETRQAKELYSSLIR